MKTFKEYLLEYLNPNQIEYFKKQVADSYPTHDNFMSSEARIATDHYFGKGNDLVREELPNYDHDKSEVHKKLEQHLNRTITPEEYKSGLISDNKGRKVRFSKVIKDPALQKEFASDNTRDGVKATNKIYATTVRGIEVGGQTNPEPNKEHPKCHSWA